jgi:hypothetical protein
MDTLPSARSAGDHLDRLGDEIAELSAHLDAASARLLERIRQFDALGGWGNGFSSCAAWLSWRVGLDPGAARERVRVARALGALPLLSAALGRGEVSYAKVRALTRVATPETEQRLLVVGRSGTAAQVERIVRGWRSVDRRAEAREARRQHATRALHVHEDHDGTVVIRGRLAPEVGALVRRALDGAREVLYRTREADAEPAPFAQQQARRRDRDAARSPRATRARRPSHPPLGARRPHDAVESRDAVPATPSRGPRGGIPGRA